MAGIVALIDRFEQAGELLKGSAFVDGGSEPDSVFMRLRRAALNQCSDGQATGSRYAIWANTVRDHISAAIEACAEDREQDAIRLLTTAHNGLSAYSEIQSVFDSLKDS